MDIIFKIVILTVLCQMTKQSSIFRNVGDGMKLSKTYIKNGDAKWLSDSIVYDDYMYQADAPVGITSQEVCPPVPQLLENEDCLETNCTSDMDCDDNSRCCFTGCGFTCLPEVKPAAVVDWIKEPQRFRSGISWLIDGPKKRTENGERCSTSPVDTDEDPLLCPYGYFCHVVDQGNPKKGIPNSGYCVKQTEIYTEITPVEEESALSASLHSHEICIVDKTVLLDGANIRLGSKLCHCTKGQLSCSITNSEPNHDVEMKSQIKGK